MAPVEEGAEDVVMLTEDEVLPASGPGRGDVEPWGHFKSGESIPPRRAPVFIFDLASENGRPFRDEVVQVCWGRAFEPEPHLDVGRLLSLGGRLPRLSDRP